MEGAAEIEKPKQVVETVSALIEEEGPLVTLRFFLGRGELKTLDPFILFAEFSVISPAGFPYHPHRGFEAVTYMLQGAFGSTDLVGHEGFIGAGDVQWMTAGKGIVHTEKSAGEGENIGVQFWVNLPSKDRMIEPSCVEIQSEESAVVSGDCFEVRVIAGEAFGIRAPALTRTPIMFLDFTLRPGACVRQAIPEQWSAFVYVVDGEGAFGAADAPPAARHQALLLGRGDGLSIWNKSPERALRFLLVGGQPLEEPVVHKGPFVMSTPVEIEASFEDYRNRRNGFEQAEKLD